MRTLPCLVLLTLGIAEAAHAQIRLPALPLPTLPLQATAQTLTQTANRDVDTLRHATIDRLIRSNRKLIEADPDGEAVVRNELLGIGMSSDALGFAAAHGFVVLRERRLAAVDLQYVVLQVPDSLSTRKALRLLREADPAGTYDYEHLYQSSNSADLVTATRDMSGTAPREHAAASRRIGLIDSGVDVSHPSFSDSRFHAWGCGGTQHPDPHGTAVAAVLIAHHPAEIYAADVYCRAATGGSVDTIVDALGWLVEQHIAVINISLVGPKNRLLEIATRAATTRGYVVVAAVGNDGPAAAPLYPAAYPGVIGVTAVDGRHRVLLEAGRGSQVMFAAVGADMSAADCNHGQVAVRGTSFAAPTVAALAAQLITLPNPQDADRALAALIARSIDLGAPGRDLTYGYGFLEDREEKQQ